MKKLLTFAIGITLMTPAFARADDDAAPDYGDALTGDWNGMRNKLHDEGYDFTALYTADFWRNFSGGIRTGNAFNDNLNLQMAIDGEKAFNMKGFSAFLWALNNDGGHPNEYLVGSVGGVDNIEVAKSRPKLFEAWVQQNFLDDKISVLAGLYAVDTEFYVTDSSALFLNPTYGMATEAGTTGAAGPAIFPESSTGARVKIQPSKDTYIMAALVGGNPADPGDPGGQKLGWGADSGTIWVGEAGYKNDDNGHYALGVWHYTRGFERFDGSGDGDDSDTGYYGLAERALWTDAGNKDRILSGFLRAGFADEDVSPYKFSWSAGISVTNAIPARKDSQFGLAMSQTKIGDDFRDSLVAGGGDVKRWETQFEVTYSDKLLPWLSVQPGLQYTVHPAMDPGLDDALTGGVRINVNF